MNKTDSRAAGTFPLRQVILAAVLGVTTGCAMTHRITELPAPHEFNQPLPALKQKYPDLTRYERTLFFAPTYRMPSATPLKAAWGEPHSTGFSSKMLWPQNWIMHPASTWHWDFSGKRVSALIDRPFLLGYRRHVWKLTVETIAPED